MMFLADTNVVSESAKQRPHPRVLAWTEAHAESTFLSAVTIGEIVKGIEKLPAGSRRRWLDTWLETLRSEEFSQRLLPVDTAVAATWGLMQAQTRRALPCADSLLAATARTYDLTIATRNERDFADLGVRVVNPWLA